MSTTIRIPHTLQNWPWPRAVHPQYEKVKKDTEAWISGFNHGFSPRLRKAMKICDYSLISAMTYYNLNDGTVVSFITRRVQLNHVIGGFHRANEFLALTLVLDEMTDVADAAQTREISDIVMDALTNPSKPRPEGECVIGEITRQWWSKTILTATPTSQRRVISGIRDYTNAVVQQSIDQEKNCIRTIDGYFQQRRGTIGLEPLAVFCQIHLNIPDYVMDNEVVKRLILAAVDLVFIDNDIFSYNVEQARGDEHNLVTIVQREFGCTIQEAFDWIGELHSKTVDQFLEDMNKVPSWGAEVDEDVKSYIDSLARWVRGNNQGSFEIHRYFGSDGLRVQRERTVQLLPKVKGSMYKDQIVPSLIILDYLFPLACLVFLSCYFLFTQSGV